MKKVLVTGADGFIGSHLVESLLNQGYEVRALAQYNSFNYLGWLEDLEQSSRLEVVSGDIRDPFFCQEITAGVETVFHLAALIAIPFSYKAPQTYVETNVTGTLNICEGCRKNGVTKLIHTSTSEVYGSAEYVPIDEKHPLKPQSPYSASKISADQMALSYFYSFELPVVVARPFNTFGPRQSARAVIPTIITQIAAGLDRIKLGDCTPTRDFNYVLDTVGGFLALEKSEKVIGKTINIGSGREIAVKDTLELIKKIMNSDIEFEFDEQRVRPKNSEVNRLLCDNSLIKELANFGPQWTLEEGLGQTVDWFLNPDNLKKYKASAYNI